MHCLIVLQFELIHSVQHEPLPEVCKVYEHQGCGVSWPLQIWRGGRGKFWKCGGRSQGKGRLTFLGCWCCCHCFCCSSISSAQTATRKPGSLGANPGAPLPPSPPYTYVWFRAVQTPPRRGSLFCLLLVPLILHCPSGYTASRGVVLSGSCGQAGQCRAVPGVAKTPRGDSDAPSELAPMTGATSPHQQLDYWPLLNTTTGSWEPLQDSFTQGGTIFFKGHPFSFPPVPRVYKDVVTKVFLLK